MSNASDPKTLREQKRRAKDRRAQEIEDIRELLKIPAGRRFLNRMLTISRTFHESFTGNSTTFYNEGKRSIGVTLAKDIALADREAFANLLSEQAEKQEADDG